ncbi:response regulator [Paenibacillus popilliae ATCC 14706]|uniref:Response regulator n=1 Tax=Paenibacillus popilliae ATCC 14706 TaxID=1212764 RepID=M9LF07_PAEPP|nr:response regulator [Paenibacillus popilliae ATCC 14706]
MTKAYEILEQVKSQGLIAVNYEAYCYSCNKFTGYSYETIGSIPEYIECEECGRELHPFKDCVVVYKVLRDE